MKEKKNHLIFEKLKIIFAIVFFKVEFTFVKKLAIVKKQ